MRDPLPYLRTAVVDGCRSLGRRQVLGRDRRPRPPDPVPLGADELWDALATLTDRQRAAVLRSVESDTVGTGGCGLESRWGEFACAITP